MPDNVSNKAQLFVRCGTGAGLTVPVKVEKNQVVWRYTMPPVMVNESANIDHVPDFFIDLMEVPKIGKDKRFAYVMI